MEKIVLPKKPGLFRYSNRDGIPVAFGIVHLCYLVSLFLVFTCYHSGWKVKVPLMAAMGIVYSFSISWNINGISHNFIHNRYFNSPLLNRLFSLLESADCVFSQVLYDYIHRRHHMGNSDKPGESGDSLDWISIYRHGKDGHAENVWKYTFGSFFREEPLTAYREIKKGNPTEARWGLVEMGLDGVIMIGATALGWKLSGGPWFILYFLPFWYFGHSFSYLNGYFEHFGGNPDVPMAWGVSTYHRLYNFVWFNNGYHAEHHFRPRAHWTRMKALRQDIETRQREVGVRVIKPPHVFGFMDPEVCDEPLVPIRKTDDAPDADDLVDVTESIARN